jgi:hypothetical protein
VSEACARALSQARAPKIALFGHRSGELCPASGSADENYDGRVGAAVQLAGEADVGALLLPPGGASPTTRSTSKSSSSPRREDAEQMLADCLADVPEWAVILEVVPVLVADREEVVRRLELTFRTMPSSFENRKLSAS